MLDATVRINEEYGETVPANSQQQIKHATYNDGQAGNDKSASVVHCRLSLYCLYTLIS